MMRKYLKYKFDLALEKNFLNLVIFLFLVAFAGIVILALIFYLLFLLGIISSEGTFLKYLWGTFAYFIDVGTIAADDYEKNTALDIIYKIVITIFGIIIFSTFIGIISQALSNRIEELREGKGSIADSNHIVIFNYTKKIIPLLSELFEAYENEDKTIIILSELRPSDVMNKIDSAISIPKNINIICRTGFAWQKKIPKFLNLKKASQIIFLKPDINEEYTTEEDCDTEVGKGLTSILSSGEWVETGGKVVVEFSNKQKKYLYNFYNLERIKKTISNSSIDSFPLIIESEDLRGRVIAQAVNTPDVIEIYDEVFGFKGSEIYFIDIKKDLEQFKTQLDILNQKNIFEINQILDHIILLGVYKSYSNKLTIENTFEPTKLDIEVNIAQSINLDDYEGFVFLATNKKQIFSEFDKLNKNSLHEVKEISPSFKTYNSPIDLAILANSVETSRILKIAQFISNGSIHNNLKSITIFVNQNIENKIQESQDKKLIQTLEELKKYHNLEIKYFDFDLFYKNTYFPYDELVKQFGVYNTFVCLFNDESDLDDNINNVKDNKVINNFIIFSNLDFQNKLFALRPHNFITEVGAFKSKDILERYKSEIYSPYYGSDIIDINTLTSKFIAQGSIDKKNVIFFNKFLQGELMLKTYSLQDTLLNTSFCELEKYFAKKNETLLGIINYKFKDVQQYMNSDLSMSRRKIEEIIINPNQLNKILLDKGDRVITLSNSKHSKV